ncbi:MAG: NUDIX domain-containing protein [Bacteroidetes bacterium]|nr:NUDIX domain-containing protein [Bacteroidota bacterium]
MELKNFNIRVYGFLIDDGKILVTDEFRLGIFMTKFPGGALEYGEGMADCLKREFREELNIKVEIISHYYTTDFFITSELLPVKSQLINVYYLVKAEKPYPFRTTDKKFDFPEVTDGAQCFRWMSIKELSEREFTFPIDKFIVKKLKADFGHSRMPEAD